MPEISPSIQKSPRPSPFPFISYLSISLSHPSYCSSFPLPSPSLSDERINFSRSICGTQWLHGASLLLKHKLISRSNPQSINHRPSTCSPLPLCLLLFHLHLTLCLPFPSFSADMHLCAHTCVRTHTHTPLSLA